MEVHQEADLYLKVNKSSFINLPNYITIQQ